MYHSILGFLTLGYQAGINIIAFRDENIITLLPDKSSSTMAELYEISVDSNYCMLKVRKGTWLGSVP